MKKKITKKNFVVYYNEITGEVEESLDILLEVLESLKWTERIEFAWNYITKGKTYIKKIKETLEHRKKVKKCKIINLMIWFKMEKIYWIGLGIILLIVAVVAISYKISLIRNVVLLGILLFVFYTVIRDNKGGKIENKIRKIDWCFCCGGR